MDSSQLFATLGTHMNDETVVVIVEDDPNIADLVELYLRRDGFRPYQADTGERALEVITERRPVIQLNLSKLGGVEADSIVMRVSGFGEVHHSYDEGAGIVRYQVPMALRNENCGVSVRFRHADNEATEEIGWNFTLDRMKSYLESIDSTLLTDEADEKKAKDKALKSNDQAAVARPDSSANKAAAVSNK